jgi:hypothetical protein
LDPGVDKLLRQGIIDWEDIPCLVLPTVPDRLPADRSRPEPCVRASSVPVRDYSTSRLHADCLRKLFLADVYREARLPLPSPQKRSITLIALVLSTSHENESVVARDLASEAARHRGGSCAGTSSSWIAAMDHGSIGKFALALNQGIMSDEDTEYYIVLVKVL